VLFNAGCNKQNFRKKRKKTQTLILKNDVTEPKARRQGYSNTRKGYSETMDSGSLKLTFNLLTV